jgi:all-trans-retinol dehydrogenase (NAD+)
VSTTISLILRMMLISLYRIVHPTWIRTPLIAELTARPEFKDFVLEPETVAEAIVEQLLSGYGAQIILPKRLGLVSLIRGWPSWLQERARNAQKEVLRS